MQDCGLPEIINTGLFGGGFVTFAGEGTEFVPIRVRSMSVVFFLENIVIKHVLPFISFLGPNISFMQDNVRFLKQGDEDHLIFQQDNATSHSTRKVQNVLEIENIQILTWPANLSDMNPIEHM